MDEEFQCHRSSCTDKRSAEESLFGNVSEKKKKSHHADFLLAQNRDIFSICLQVLHLIEVSFLVLLPVSTCLL